MRWQVLETAIEVAIKDRRCAERQLETMQLAAHQQPMSVALRFEVDFEDMFQDAAGLQVEKKRKKVKHSETRQRRIKPAI